MNKIAQLEVQHTAALAAHKKSQKRAIKELKTPDRLEEDKSKKKLEDRQAALAELLALDIRLKSALDLASNNKSSSIYINGCKARIADNTEKILVVREQITILQNPDQEVKQKIIGIRNSKSEKAEKLALQITEARAQLTDLQSAHEKLVDQQQDGDRLREMEKVRETETLSRVAQVLGRLNTLRECIEEDL